MSWPRVRPPLSKQFEAPRITIMLKLLVFASAIALALGDGHGAATTQDCDSAEANSCAECLCVRDKRKKKRSFSAVTSLFWQCLMVRSVIVIFLTLSYLFFCIRRHSTCRAVRNNKSGATPTWWGVSNLNAASKGMNATTTAQSEAKTNIPTHFQINKLL